MKLKRIIVLLGVFMTVQLNAQVKFGNWMYGNHKPVNIQSSSFNQKAVVNGFNDNLFKFNPGQTIVIKTMYNLKPDAFVAVFSLSQEGEEQAEVDSLMGNRIKQIKKELAGFSSSINLKVDIISFVPLYEQVLEKKIFGKNSYIEKPKGFELKKNIIILFQSSEQMDKIFSICSNNEVYDFVRVDFVCTQLAKAKSALRKTSDSLLQIQLKRYAGLLDIDFKDYNKTLSEGFKVVYPAERYLSYTAFGGTSYFLKKYNMKEVKKNVTKHYMPIIDNEFDLVFNPVVDEPVIQVLYNINLHFRKKPKERTVAPKADKDFFWMTPNGDIKKLPTN